MIRSIPGGTMTIRSRIGSGGRVVISTMTLPSSRRSVIPPRAPAGAGSAGSVSSTTSPTATSSIVAIPPSVGLGIGGDQPGCRSFICVVPSREHGCGAVVDPRAEQDAQNLIEQLGLRTPSVRGAREGVTDSRWPLHRPDARDRDFTRVRLRSILRVVTRTKLERVE